MLLLDTVGSEDASIADLNRDGRLDLVVSSYHAGVNRHHPSYVFWGAESGLDPESGSAAHRFRLRRDGGRLQPGRA